MENEHNAQAAQVMEQPEAEKKPAEQTAQGAEMSKPAGQTEKPEKPADGGEQPAAKRRRKSEQE